MNWPYIHTLVNHFPIILTVVGAAALVSALIWRTRGAWLYALATLTLAGLAAYPAFLTGDEAADVMRKRWYVVRSMVEAHEESADFALWTLLVMGALCAYGWWRMTRREPGTLPPRWLRLVVLFATLAALGTVTYSAYLGGRIVHDSPRLITVPPGFDTTTASTRSPARGQ